MNNIPTASELLDAKYSNFEDLDTGNIWENVEQTMIEFARLHCEAQLQAILKNVETTLWQNNENLEIVSNRADYIINHIPIKDLIINAYNIEENIK